MKIDDCFIEGGTKLVNLLNFCVFSVNTDALFLYLVREYRFRPSAASALAIFELFCEPSAPAEISTSSLLRTSDRTLADAIEGIRQAIQSRQKQSTEADASDSYPSESNPPNTEITDSADVPEEMGGKIGDLSESEENELDDGWISNPVWSETSEIESVDYSSCPPPPSFLFDAAERQLRGSGSKKLVMIERVYRPESRPLENLPGKKMSSGQRHFVEAIWSPTVRPRLVAAGFWRVASIG